MKGFHDINNYSRHRKWVINHVSIDGTASEQQSQYDNVESPDRLNTATANY